MLATVGGALRARRSPGDGCRRSLAVLVVGAASFCCLGIALTALIPSQDAAAPIVNVILFPLYFLSGVFIPEDELPAGVINFADIFPIRHFFEAFFDAYVPGGPGARASPGDTWQWSRSGGSPASCSRSASSAGPRGAAERRRPADLPPHAAYSLPLPMLHHVLLEVSDLERSASFYDALLAPLGWRRHFEEDGTIGWGIAKPVFFIADHHDPRPGFGLLSFSGLGIVAVKASWEAGRRSRRDERRRARRTPLLRLRLLLGVPQGPRRVRDRGHDRQRLTGIGGH